MTVHLDPMRYVTGPDLDFSADEFARRMAAHYHPAPSGRGGLEAHRRGASCHPELGTTNTIGGEDANPAPGAGEGDPATDLKSSLLQQQRG